MVFENSSSTINIESWFIPFDIIMIMCCSFAVILAIFFLIIIALDQTCRTVPMMLVANSCLAELLFASDVLGTILYSLENDLKQVQYQDSLCMFRGYACYVGVSAQNFSYLLQAIYRYIIIIYPNRIFLQSARFQAFIICLGWVLSVVSPIPYYVIGAISYSVEDQMCQMPLQLNFLTIYSSLSVCVIPVSLTMLIYFTLVRYVREMSKHVVVANTLIRAQRELKMVRRIVILITGVLAIVFPYTAFIFMSFFTTLPKYHFRIAYVFISVSLAFVMIAIYKFTEPLKAFVKKVINGRTNMVLPTTT